MGSPTQKIRDPDDIRPLGPNADARTRSGTRQPRRYRAHRDQGNACRILVLALPQPGHRAARDHLQAEVAVYPEATRVRGSLRLREVEPDFADTMPRVFRPKEKT
jgi:hypothetical protein